MFPGPPPTDARNAGRQTAHANKEVQPQPTTYAPLSVRRYSWAPPPWRQSPSRPVLPTDHKPGGSSRLSPATRRRPASATAADGKDPAPPYRGPGDLSPSCPRGARTAGLASPTVVDRTVRSVTTDGARNDRPAWPGPRRPYKSKNAAPRTNSLAKAASPTRSEAKGHQPGEGRRTPRSCTADAARKREDGQPRQRSSPARPPPPGRA